jgi:hypothetical protein
LARRPPAGWPVYNDEGIHSIALQRNISEPKARTFYSFS